MTLIETTQLLLIVDQADADNSDHVCLDRSHVAVDRVCTTCHALHLPSMEQGTYCPCGSDAVVHVGTNLVTGGPGILVWRCQACGLPNLDVLRGRLPEGKPGGTMTAPDPCR